MVPLIALGLTAAISGLDLKAAYLLCLRDSYAWDNTIAACTAVIESPTATAHMKFRAYGHRANSRFHGKREYAAAIDDISHSVALEPKNWRGHMVRAEIHYGQENYAAAIPDLSEVLLGEPDNIGALELRATSYYRTNQRDLAIADQRELVRLQPHKSDPVWFLASMYEDKKDFARARATYNQALALDHGWAGEFPAACFDDDPLFDLATNNHPTPVLKNWPACEKAGR